MKKSIISVSLVFNLIHKTRSMWESYSAFANTNGGVILLGVKEDNATKELIPVGVEHTEKMMSEIWNTLNNSQRVMRFMKL